MGTAYKGGNATNIAGNIPKLAEEGQQGGVKKIIYDSFALTADLASGDTIVMGGLVPAGAMIVGCELISDALVGSCTVNVGWQASADGVESASAAGLFSAAAVSTASVLGLGSTGGAPGAFGKVFPSPVQLVIAENAVSSGATGKYIRLALSYIET